jgi:hypothetical protein
MTRVTFPGAAGAAYRRVLLASLRPNPLINASLMFDSRLGGIAGNACTNNLTAGASAGVAWSTIFLDMMARVTCTAAGAAFSGGTSQFRPIHVDLVRLLEADPAYSSMPRRQFGTYEIFGWPLVYLEGALAGAWSARFGIYAPRNVATGVFGQGVMFLCSDAGANWRAVIEVKGNPETNQLRLVDVDLGIPYSQRIYLLGIRVGASSDTNPYVEWLVNGVVAYRRDGTIGTRFQNVGPTAQESMSPGFGITKAVIGDPNINIYSSGIDVYGTPGPAL